MFLNRTNQLYCLEWFKTYWYSLNTFSIFGLIRYSHFNEGPGMVKDQSPRLMVVGCRALFFQALLHYKNQVRQYIINLLSDDNNDYKLVVPDFIKELTLQCFWFYVIKNVYLIGLFLNEHYLGAGGPSVHLMSVQIKPDNEIKLDTLSNVWTFTLGKVRSVWKYEIHKLKSTTTTYFLVPTFYNTRTFS